MIKIPCVVAGCPELCDPGEYYCPRHKLQRERRYNRIRPKRHQLYQTAAHRQWRRAVLARDPVCKMCGAARSVIADHIVPIAHGGSWDLSNGQGLCRRCHNHKTALDRASS